MNCRPIKLVVAKCWDPNPKGYFTIPRTEPVRPIDPGAWVAHTEAARGKQQFKTSLRCLDSSTKLSVWVVFHSAGGVYPNRPPSVATMTSTTTSLMSSLPESERMSFSRCISVLFTFFLVWLCNWIQLLMTYFVAPWFLFRSCWRSSANRSFRHVDNCPCYGPSWFRPGGSRPTLAENCDSQRVHW